MKSDVQQQGLTFMMTKMRGNLNWMFLFLLLPVQNMDYVSRNVDVFKVEQHGVKLKWYIETKKPYKVMYIQVKNKEGHTFFLRNEELIKESDNSDE